MTALAMRIYRRLAYAFPHEFQMVYGADVIQMGEDAIDQIWEEQGYWGLVRLLVDIAWRLPVEYLAEIRRDAKYALRTLGRSRGFTVVGILSLGLGIGLATISASEFFKMILPDMPGAAKPDELAILVGTPYPYLEHFRAQHDLFTGAAAYMGPVPFNVAIPAARAGAGEPRTERAFGHVVSPEYFSVLGVSAARGRTFDPRTERPGSPPVVFITDGFWRTQLDSDPNAVDGALRVNGQTATIVGIGPRDFVGVVPVAFVDIFVPTTAPAAMVPELAGGRLERRDLNAFNGLLRLAPGVAWQAADAALDGMTRVLDAGSPDAVRNGKGRHIVLLPGGKKVPLPRLMFPVLIGLSLVMNGLILGVACMNLANIQLARATARRREVAIRLSVGASRFRLIRQLLIESVMLSSAGGVVGILFAYWAAAGVRCIKLPYTLPFNLDVTPDWRALLMALAISLAAGIFFGLAPALTSTRTDLALTLKEEALVKVRGYRRFGLRNLLVVSQVAGSLMLLLVTGFLLIGSLRSNQVEVAFDARDMSLISLDPVRDGYSAERAAELFENLPERLKTVPGVKEVTLSDTRPSSPLVGTETLLAASPAGGADREVNGIAKQLIGPRYFASLSVKLTEGREFAAADERVGALPAILNESAARELFGDRDALGGRLRQAADSYEVVGVVKDQLTPMSPTGNGSAATNRLPTIYAPLTRRDFAHSPPEGMTVMVRMAHGADAMKGVRRVLAGMDPNLVVFGVRTLTEQVEQTTFLQRVNTIVYSVLGVFGVILAAMGVAGVTGYSVTRRRREIGIRMALGARRGQVLRLVMREGGALVLAGLALGFLGGVSVARMLAAMNSVFGPAFLAGIEDPLLLWGAPLLLGGLAMLACYWPARGSAEIDPLRALREE